MNTANLQLEGLYLCVAGLANTLVAKGIMTREDLDGVLAAAETTALTDYRSEELSDANRDAVAFPARLLRAMNNGASKAGVPAFSEMARLVGTTKNKFSFVQRTADTGTTGTSTEQQQDEVDSIRGSIRKTADRADPDKQ